MSIRYLAEHCKSIDDEDVFVMVENNSKLQFTLGVDYNDEQRLGRLRVVDTYMEKYLVGFSLFITRDRNGGYDKHIWCNNYNKRFLLQLN